MDVVLLLLYFDLSKFPPLPPPTTPGRRTITTSLSFTTATPRVQPFATRLGCSTNSLRVLPQTSGVVRLEHYSKKKHNPRKFQTLGPLELVEHLARPKSCHPHHLHLPPRPRPSCDAHFLVPALVPRSFPRTPSHAFTLRPHLPEPARTNHNLTPTPHPQLPSTHPRHVYTAATIETFSGRASPQPAPRPHQPDPPPPPPDLCDHLSRPPPPVWETITLESLASPCPSPHASLIRGPPTPASPTHSSPLRY
ncbi:hypothetical protein E2C01_042522 [Portunus trituberculatus]|uniref:Uncharacterized protein n=1 Tax=Portunus trituberculatus TaxID=210409 RepID=A0A5B7FM18_PORTR|nr:hypothetical protein [Portunus trituberculatus]